ncbi:MAG: DUF4160 domain-containing protein [Elusimicrobia bacterium]|nr:DUF4160 domain-containing protein [Candidatus Obscuribacterium magneticum]MCB4756380.1 DUF4160 domain-containing protein [Candidatus Obscuribacterium magneticum]
MSPTVFRHKNYRFFFFSREERRVHIHVSCPDGEAKFWLEPIVSLCEYHGLSPRKLRGLQKVVEGKKDEIIKAWKKHFKS